jgi:glycosyltransferase involved in cell wall biosynthesis
MREYVTVSIICPTYNEEKYIVQCLNSIIGQDYPLNKMEVFFFDGKSTDKTREIISEYVSKYEFIRLLNNPNRTAPYALNIDIREAKGEVIVRIDAHSDYPTNYISILVKYLFELNADNVGGICATHPQSHTAIAIYIAIGSNHPFGVGNSMFRIGAKNIMEVLRETGKINARLWISIYRRQFFFRRKCTRQNRHFYN